MTEDRIITRHISAYHAWQGPESEAPARRGEIIPHDCPISEVASWLLNQASRDYRQHEIDALRTAGAILAALEGGTAFCNDGPQLAAMGAWRWETQTEHIARDMREGRFPEQSERQRVPAVPDPSGDLISREAALAHLMASSEIASEDKWHAAHTIRSVPAALPAQGQPATPRPPIQAEGYDIDAMVANLKAHPEWPAMNNAGDVKLYFMNEGDALAMRFAAALECAQ